MQEHRRYKTPPLMLGIVNQQIQLRAIRNSTCAGKAPSMLNVIPLDCHINKKTKSLRPAG